MRIEFTPSKLQGKIKIPPSKSMSHRSILCAALANGASIIENISLSKDIQVTLDAIKSLGADYTFNNSNVSIAGISSIPEHAKIDCCESGSTLRFLIPIVCALGVNADFHGQGKLPSRPITPYITELGEKGINFEYNNNMPFSVNGKLKSGKFVIDGNISSQFVTGLLMALPLLNGGSEIIINGRLESKPYVTMTIDVLKQFGVEISETSHGYSIMGSQRFMPKNYRVEGDYSQAAFFAVAGACGGSVEIQDLDLNSAQGDKEIFNILSNCGADITKTSLGFTVSSSKKLMPFEIDASDIPDLVPILAVLACVCEGKSIITGAQRLKIKESDRLIAISESLNKIGGRLIPYDDKLEIYGVGSFHGGIVESFNDHRIAMSVAIASLYSDKRIILNQAESINKSYPGFYQDFNSLGGKSNVINME